VYVNSQPARHDLTPFMFSLIKICAILAGNFIHWRLICLENILTWDFFFTNNYGHFIIRLR
jgi:hypothetical protein